MSVLLRSLNMATELKDYIKIYDNVIDKSFADKVIETFDLDFENHEYIDREKRPSFTQLNITKQYNDKESKWRGIQEQIQQVFIDYVGLYMQSLDCAPDFPSKYCFEEYRIKKYNTAVDEFKDHVDVQDYNSARRFLVCFLYLNRPNSGGLTSFPKLDYAVEPRVGRVLIFPPTWMYRHAGQPVISGTKYIIGSYLHYL